MNRTPRLTKLNDVWTRYRAGRISRRTALRLVGGLGLTTAGAVAIGTRGTGAKPAIAEMPAEHIGHGRLHPVMAGQEATPPAAATPALGERPDGTFLWRVKVAGMDMENLIDTQAFFPSEITINAGDAIFFELPAMPGFHTVTFLSGQEVPPLFVPDETAPATPSAGPPKLILNPAASLPSGGDTYDGTGLVNSGLDVFRQPTDPPLVYTFTTPGTYEYQCIPHGVVMKGSVIVQEAGAERPEDQAAADARGESERSTLIEEGMAETAAHTEATQSAQDDGSTLWDVAAGVGEGQARVLRFLPDTLEIKAGDTVRWSNLSKTEPHTVTFLGEDGEQPEDVLVEPQASGPPKFVQNPLTLFPQGVDLQPGTGYINSGFLGELNGQPLPGTDAFELTFETPGEYHYYCILHASGPEGPGMAGTITVT